MKLPCLQIALSLLMLSVLACGATSVREPEIGIDATIEAKLKLASASLESTKVIPSPTNTTVPTSIPGTINQSLDNEKQKLQETNKSLKANNAVLQERLEKLEIEKNAADDLSTKIDSEYKDLVRSEKKLQENNKALEVNNALLVEKLRSSATPTSVPDYTPTPTATAIATPTATTIATPTATPTAITLTPIPTYAPMPTSANVVTGKPTSYEGVTITYANGDSIPSKTVAGSDSCINTITSFCVEILAYEGVTEDGISRIRIGIDAAASMYLPNKSELVVDWPEFGINGGKQNYVGIVLWHSEQSDRDKIADDVCKFRYVGLKSDTVPPEGSGQCIDATQSALDRNSRGGAMHSAAASPHNGYVIYASEKMWGLQTHPYHTNLEDPELARKDPRKIAVHEFVHAYQTSHTVSLEKNEPDQIRTEGPIWLVEGSAEYAALRVAASHGWMNWEKQLDMVMGKTKAAIKEHPSISLKMNETPVQRSEIRKEPYGHVLTYEMGIWATAYAISISSHDAVMIKYWDDLYEYGPMESFRQNVGITLNEFYSAFSTFLQLDQKTQLARVFNQTDFITHLDGNLIPAKTVAGSDSCLDTVTSFCVEILAYEGVTENGINNIKSGIEAATSAYLVKDYDLIVDWEGFGNAAGKQTYVGVVLWHPERSDKNKIIQDMCKFRNVAQAPNTPTELSQCEALNKILLDDLWGSKGVEMISGTPSHNGYIVFIPESTWNKKTFEIGSDETVKGRSDPRKITAHELIHVYQTSHTVSQKRMPSDQIPNEGPIWLVEGSAEYGALRTSSALGWINWSDHMKWAIQINNAMMDRFPNVSLSMIETFSQKANISTDKYSRQFSSVLTYETGLLATAYAISISNHDAVMIKYWDDIDEFGPEEAFRRNVGMTITEFYSSFSSLLKLENDEILKQIVSAPAEKPDHIVFVSERDGNKEIYVMKVDGTDIVRLTNNTANDLAPASSPDGRRIAFTSDRDGDKNIHVMNTDGTGVVRLTNNAAEDSEPSWSPDGHHIAFTSDRDGDKGIYVMNNDGGNMLRITNWAGQESHPTWSPDGRRIAFTSDLNGTDGIYVINTENLVITKNTEKGWHPVWSPDGRHIAFTSDQDGDKGIYVMNTDGTGVVRLTNIQESHPVWSPDGRRIAFTSDRDGDKGIHVMNTDGTGVVRLTNNAAEDSEPSWSPK